MNIDETLGWLSNYLNRELQKQRAMNGLTEKDREMFSRALLGYQETEHLLTLTRLGVDDPRIEHEYGFGDRKPNVNYSISPTELERSQRKKSPHKIGPLQVAKGHDVDSLWTRIFNS